MGLDMYLSKKVYIGANYDHNKIEGKIELTQASKPIAIDLKKVTYVIEEAGYWRKANQIHAWFVKNIQDGKDECQESYVDYSKLIELKELCQKVIDEKKPELLPPQSGFFFGSTEVDEYYYGNLMATIKIIEDLSPNEDYYYRASW